MRQEGAKECTSMVYEEKEATLFTIPMKEYTTVVLTAPSAP